MKPVAPPTPDTQEWFDLIDQQRLTVPRCRSCASFFLYPRSSCPRCGAREIELVPAAGTGTLLSFVINHRGSAGFDAPYALGMIELAEGPRVLTGIVTDDIDALAVGDSVRAVFEARGERRVLHFAPDEEGTR